MGTKCKNSIKHTILPFDTWLQLDHKARQQTPYGSPPEFKPGVLAIVHPRATYPWSKFCGWVGELAFEHEVKLWVSKLNSQWVIVTEEDPELYQDEWVGTVTQKGKWSLFRSQLNK